MNIPLALTFIRLLFSPFIPAALLVFLLPTASVGMHLFLATIFAVMALTDFFDGYLARRYKQETVIGRVLDPIADKLLVLSTGIALVHIGKMYWLWLVIIMSREVLIMGLRELALTYSFSLPVSQSGKYKSAVQYLYFMAIIAGYRAELLGYSMIVITLWSGYQYVVEFLRCFNKK